MFVYYLRVEQKSLRENTQNNDPNSKQTLTKSAYGDLLLLFTHFVYSCFLSYHMMWYSRCSPRHGIPDGILQLMMPG